MGDQCLKQKTLVRINLNKTEVATIFTDVTDFDNEKN